MKKTAQFIGTLIVGITCSLWLTGCGEGDHAGHDHDHDHDHDHGTETTQTTAHAGDQLAGALSGAISATADAAKDAVDQAAKEVESLTDEAIIKAQSATYPLKKCVVSGEDLGSMGGAVNFVHGGTLIKLCCEHCVPDVEKDPAKFVAMVKEAIAK
ncbi:MAG: hypothetical protein O2964_09275 [Verrucomicrobia bacterium]|jgi:hypothetical protein|nr:hypothetical protein [Verrucomicrobiota bacterium]